MEDYSLGRKIWKPTTFNFLFGKNVVCVALFFSVIERHIEIFSRFIKANFRFLALLDKYMYYNLGELPLSYNN